MGYTATQDYYNSEFDFDLFEGDVPFYGDIEPDLMANLTAKGVLVADGGAAVEPASEPEADDVPDDEAPEEDE